MNKYINADEIKQQMIKYGWKHPDSTVHEFVDDLPSADVVEIVRCKDCKYFNKITSFCTRKTIPKQAVGNSFCPYGERRETE